MTPTAAGEFRHRVTIVRQAGGPGNELGEPSANADAPLVAWARVRPMAAAEVARNASVPQDTTHEVRMRFTPLVQPSGRLEFNGRRLEITGVVDVDEERRELAVYCRESK